MADLIVNTLMPRYCAVMAGLFRAGLGIDEANALLEPLMDEGGPGWRDRYYGLPAEGKEQAP